jgi:hypothetical protein
MVKYMNNKPHSEETKQKMRGVKKPWVSLARKGKPAWNKGISDVVRTCPQCNQDFIVPNYLPKKLCSLKCRGEKHAGKNHYLWIEDRSKVKTSNLHDAKRKIWSKTVYKRDNYTCKMQNSDCNGRLEAHHILRWADYPELRYDINNGITLCKFHHPRKKETEQEMAPIFTKIININI